ncbi:MAG: type III secretion system inner membrane ring subunit SctD [Parachlamydiales bacterium]|nr:type III secretion system inner membrane ring subunit SctD [Parachlamydiales bacterium]
MVAKLIAEEGLLQGTSFVLDDRDEWFIGRDPEVCDITLEDPTVSRRHLHIRRTSSGFTIENLSTSNPATINDAALQEPHLLKEDEKLRIGDTTFHLSVKEETEASSPDLETLLPAEDVDNLPYETIFEPLPEAATPPQTPSHFDLNQTSRFVLKVVTGPQTGAEFNLEPQQPYLIGTDVATCDIVFHDLSISRQHARLVIVDDEQCLIEDMNSRNGVLVDGQVIDKEARVPAQHLITLGTTSFIIIDREKASETIVSYSKPQSVKTEETVTSSEPLNEPKPQFAAKSETVVLQKPFQLGGTIITVVILAICLMVGAGVWSLFDTKKVTLPQKDYPGEIQTALKDFPDVSFSFNRTTGRLFLLGHVLTAVEKSQLLYNLQSFNFISSTDDNVIIDEYVWQQMNSLLVKNPDWKGIAIHSTAPGKFVVTGYLKTRQEAADLNDYLLLHFNYLDRLDNQVAVEQDLFESVASDLIQNGFSGVSIDLTNGELVLAGYMSTSQSDTFSELVKKWQAMQGIRGVKVFVVKLSPEEAISDLSSQFAVTGTSRVGDETTSVIINNRIYSISDVLNGYTIVRITSNTVFLEKSGLKYKISYNQQ